MTAFNAAVLALTDNAENPHLLVTVRATNMRTHAGQISLPGGGRDPGETAEHTALRETWEEVGIAPENIRVHTQMPALTAPRTGHVVIPVIGELNHPHEQYSLKINPTEVASAHWIALADLADSNNRGTWQRADRTGPGFVVGDLMIWGLTAHIIDRFLVNQNLHKPWDVTRILQIPRRFDCS